MKKLIIFLLMMLPLGVFAQETKIAVVNTQTVIEAMPEFAEMQKQIADMQKKYQDEMKIMEEEYQKKYSAFVAQQDSLTENIKVRRMQELQDMEQRLHGDTSLNEFAYDDSEEEKQSLLTDGTPTVEEALMEHQEQSIRNQKLAAAIASLNPREQEIVKARFLTDEPVTLEDLGRQFQISRERVRQIETKAFQKISNYMLA